MKTHTSLLLSVVLPLASAGIAYPEENKPQAVAAASPRHWELRIVDGVLVVKDNARGPATLRQVTDYLVELYPANVVLAPTLANVRIGNLKLAGFRWESALEALRIASGNQFMWSRQTPSALMEVDPTTGVPRSPAGGDEAALYVLEPDPAGASHAGGRVVEVFNLAGYLHDKDEDQVAQALKEVELILAESLDQVRAGSGVFEAEPRPSIRFHQRASLLVLVGTAEQVDVARKIILALPGAAPSQATAGTGYGAGAMGGGGAMGGAGFGGGGGFGGSAGGRRYGGGGMDESMMNRYGLVPRQVPGAGVPSDPTLTPRPPGSTGSHPIAPSGPGK
jgi:hypothetical protein